MAASVVTSQRDFSAGEVDASLKRGDDMPEFKAGVRQCANFRILNSKKLSNRPGRRALFKASDRVEEVLMAPGVTYYLAFPSGFLKVFDATGTQVFSEARPWNANTASNVVWAIYNKSIYITFAGMIPRILTWDGATTWTTADFAFAVSNGRRLCPFYRFAASGITMALSALTGAGVTVTFSSPVLNNPLSIGTRFRYYEKQIEITGVTSTTVATATVDEIMHAINSLRFTASVVNQFAVGDIGVFSTSGQRVYVVAVGTPTVNDLTLLFINNNGVAGGDTLIGPNGSAIFNVGLGGLTNGPAITVWDEEVINAYRGYPASCFVDQNRLGLCNLPSVPSGIAWSAFGLFDNFYVGADPTAAIFELAPNKSQVLYVIPGMDASEFVFCDNKLYYIQITPANPLKPGSVSFSTISEDECAQVQPRRAGEFMLYVTGGGNQIMALKIFGAYTRAYKTESVSELSAHLFTSVRAIAIMTGSGTFAERYAFVLNADGSVVVGKYSVDKNAELSGNVGWAPWTGNGTMKWVSCKGANILFTTSYAPNGIGAVQIVELLDDSRYLDASQLYNTQPSGLPIPGGKGPLWWIAGGTVDLMDTGARMMGTYVVDANGFLVAQNNAGEDFTSAGLVCGQAWTATLEPFIPAVQAGQDVGQRMWPRRVKRIQAYVQNSSGFLFARLYSGQSGPNLPAQGAVMGSRRIATWNQDEDPTQPPSLREQSYLYRPMGRAHDPRAAIIKDTPGPLTVLELSCEVTV